MATKLGVINQALVELGDDPITSLETDDGAGAEVARVIYDRVVNAMFTPDAYKFRFATKQFKLNQISGEPMDADNGGFKYAYALPSDYLSLVYLQTSQDYQIYGQELRCNDTNLIMDYIARVDEGLWPATFEEMVIFKLAAEMAKPVTDDSSLKQEMIMAYQEAKRTAKQLDSKNVPNKPFSSSPLLQAHRGRSRGGRGGRYA